MFAPHRGSTRRALLACGALAALPARAAERPAAGAASVTGGHTVLTVAAFPLVDEIIRAALPAWRQRQPQVHIHLVSRQYGDHQLPTPARPIHDACVTGYLLAPELYEQRLCNVTVDIVSPETIGMTVVDWWHVTGRRRNCNVLRRPA